MEKWDTLEELCETLQRGNEINFRYREKEYGIFPYWKDGHVKGYKIGENYSHFTVCNNINELSDYIIDGKRLGDIYIDIFITDRTF